MALETVALYEIDDEGRETFVWSGPLVDFFADNEMEPDTQDEIRDELRRAGRYYGGGGAQPLWLLMSRERRNNPDTVTESELTKRLKF